AGRIIRIYVYACAPKILTEDDVSLIVRVYAFVKRRTSEHSIEGMRIRGPGRVGFDHCAPIFLCEEELVTQRKINGSVDRVVVRQPIRSHRGEKGDAVRLVSDIQVDSGHERQVSTVLMA